jgi:hypothetical protein
VGVKQADRLVVYVAGEGAAPETADARATLEVAAAYIDFLVRLAEEHGEKLDLHGLKVIPGSIGIEVYSSTPKIVGDRITEAEDLLEGRELPSSGKIQTALNRLERSVRALPEGWGASVAAGPTYRFPLYVVRHEEEGADLWTTTTLRAQPLRVGGKAPRVQFQSPSESKPFTVGTNQETAREVAKYLYREVEVSIRFVRDEDGTIKDGWLEEFWPVDASADEIERWRAWFRDAGAHWDDIEDVNAELGRGSGGE